MEAALECRASAQIHGIKEAYSRENIGGACFFLALIFRQTPSRDSGSQHSAAIRRNGEHQEGIAQPRSVIVRNLESAYEPNSPFSFVKLASLSDKPTANV
jgi:hypothetical protein